MMLKKLFINISLVALTVFTLDFTVGKLLRHFYFSELSGPHQRTTYTMEQTKADILIFGSSRANHHYIPQIFEDSFKLTCYNTGRDANGIFFQEAMLRSILKRYTPKMIVLDFSGGFGISNDSYDNISSLLPYYDDHPEIRNIVEMKSDFEKVKLLSEIYPYNSQILTIAIGNLELNRKRNEDVKGYVALYNKIPPNIGIADTPSIPRLEPDTNKINAMLSFVRQAKASGSKLYVVYSPYYQNYSNDPDIALCAAICRKNNIPFLDFSADRQFIKNNALFHDEVHLNDSGARVFTQRLIRTIRNN